VLLLLLYVARFGLIAYVLFDTRGHLSEIFFFDLLATNRLQWRQFH